jgi:hypothetical protein
VWLNLHNGMWVVADMGGVRKDLATSKGGNGTYHPSLILKDVTFHVSEASHRRIKRLFETTGKRGKDIHAWAVGTVVETLPDRGNAARVTYNPFTGPAYFTLADHATRVWHCDFVAFNQDRTAVAYGSVK